MAKMYTDASNARRAAVALVAKYPDVLTVSSPIRAPGITPMFFPAVFVKGELSAADKAAIEATVRIVDEQAQPDDETDALPSAPAKAPKPPKAKKPPVKKAAKKGAAKKAPAKKAPAKKATPRTNTKSQQALALMQRKEGATAEELMSKMGWLSHTLRAFVSNENRLNGRGIETVRTKDKPTRYVLVK